MPTDWSKIPFPSPCTPATEREVLGFIVEVVDLAPESEMVGRMAVIRDAIVRYLAQEPLHAGELRVRLSAQDGGEGERDG
jgi:hypothetical protein